MSEMRTMHNADTSPVPAAPAKWVTIPLASSCTGYSEKAIRRKIEDGAWHERTYWKRAPDGRIGRCILPVGVPHADAR